MARPRVTASAILVLVAGLLFMAGCVRRTIMITSEPPGALVWLNDREIGRTPVDVDFEFYGRYDVRLHLPGSEPLMTSGNALPPVWEAIGLDLIAEMVPITLHRRIKWHYVLRPMDDDPEALIGRAQRLRSEIPGARPPADVPQEP